MSTTTNSQAINQEPTVQSPAAAVSVSANASVVPQSNNAIHLTSAGDVVGAFFDIMSSFAEMMNANQESYALTAKAFMAQVRQVQTDMTNSAHATQWSAYLDGMGSILGAVGSMAQMGLTAHYGQDLDRQMKQQQGTLTNLKKFRDTTLNSGQLEQFAVNGRNGAPVVDAAAPNPDNARLGIVTRHLNNNNYAELGEMSNDPLNTPALMKALTDRQNGDATANFLTTTRQTVETQITQQTTIVNTLQSDIDAYRNKCNTKGQIVKALSDAGFRIGSGERGGQAKIDDAQAQVDTAFEKMLETIMQSMSQQIQSWGQSEKGTGDALRSALRL